MVQSPDKTHIGPPATIVEPSGAVWSIRSDAFVLRAATATSVPVVTTVRAMNGCWLDATHSTKMGVYFQSSVAPKHWFKVVIVKPNGVVTWVDVGVNDPGQSVAPPPPTITGFAVTPTSVSVGQGVVLSATVANASSVTLDGVPVTLPYTHTPVVSRSYQLVATGAVGTTPAISPLIAVTVTAVVVPPPTKSVVTFNAPSMNPGAPITVNLAGGAGNAQDWLTITKVTDSLDVHGLWAWAPTAAFSWQTTLPTVAGQYEARYFLNNSNVLTAKSAPFTVTLPYAEPVKSFPPLGLAVSVGVPVSLLQYVSSALPLVFDPVDDADKTLTAAGVFTAKRVVAAGTVTSAYDDGH